MGCATPLEKVPRLRQSKEMNKGIGNVKEEYGSEKKAIGRYGIDK